MSDPNKFINTYIDTIIATLHEHLGSSLQLKTQLKLANDLLVERDEVINRLNTEIEQLRAISQDNNSISNDLASCQDRLKIAEESHTAIKAKLSHMDTLLNQLSEMKREIVSRDEKIASLEEKLNAVPKVPPVKAASTSSVKLNTKVKTTKTDDDF